DQAMAQFRRVRDIDPNFPRAGLIANAYIEKGMFNEAFAVTQSFRKPDDAWSLAMRAYVAGRSNRQEDARRARDELQKLYAREPLDAGPMLVAFLVTRDTHAAFIWSDKPYP